MNVEIKRSIQKVIEQAIQGYNLLVEEDDDIDQESVETAYKCIQCLMKGDSVHARMYAESAKDQDIKWRFMIMAVIKVHELSSGMDYV